MAARQCIAEDAGIEERNMAYRFTPTSTGIQSPRREAAEPDDQPPMEASGSGWFDSSFDLQRGLEVTVLDLAWPDTEPVAWLLS